MPPTRSSSYNNAASYMAPYIGESLRQSPSLPSVYTTVLPPGQISQQPVQYSEYGQFNSYTQSRPIIYCATGYTSQPSLFHNQFASPDLNFHVGNSETRNLEPSIEKPKRSKGIHKAIDEGTNSAIRNDQEYHAVHEPSSGSCFEDDALLRKCETNVISGKERRTYPPRPLLLGQLSEDNEDDDEDNGGEVMAYSEWEKIVPMAGNKGCKLHRTDSLATVAHIYEDLLVSNRLGIRITLTNLGIAVLGVACLMPNSAAILYTVFRLVFGTLFPAYYSYKAIRTKSVKDYVKWMMYWIVFAFFTCIETVTDIFVSFWFPFYYEFKILVVLWLLSPATRGSSILYRKFVHPWLTNRENEIDKYIATAKHEGWSAVVELGQRGVTYTTDVLMRTAIKGGGDLVKQLRRSYSTGELCDEGDMNSNVKAIINCPDDDSCNLSSGTSPPSGMCSRPKGIGTCTTRDAKESL